MNNKVKIIIGWFLLAIGVAIIFYSLFSSYNIFTGKAAVPDVFSATGGKTTAQNETGTFGGLDVQKMIGDQLKGLLPNDAITKTLNLAVWGVLAWILIMAGGQIAGIGIKLLKAN